MAPRTRLIPRTPTRIMTAPSVPGPASAIVSALMTLIALVPCGAVLGFVLALKTGQDRILFAGVGALMGALISWWKRKS